MWIRAQVMSHNSRHERGGGFLVRLNDDFHRWEVNHEWT
jgi:hypothetical protein